MRTFYPINRRWLNTCLCLLCWLTFLPTVLFSSQSKKEFDTQQQTGGRLPFYISDQGILCYNLSAGENQISTIQIDLNEVFRNSTVEHLRSKHYELSDTAITIINYNAPPISARYKIIDNKFVVSKSSDWPTGMQPAVRPMALDSLKYLEALFDTNDLNGLLQLEATKLPLENILLFFSQLHGFSTVEEFSYNAIHRILEKGQYAIVKQFYRLFLTRNRQFNDFEVLKTAIEKNDMDFIRHASLNSLNRLGIDKVKADYSFTQCTLLGKAILMKNKIAIDYLLQKGATTNNVYQYESEVLSASQLAQRTKSEKIIKLFH